MGKFMDEVGKQIFAGCFMFMLLGVMLGLGAIGLDYFYAFLKAYVIGG